jgi:23S rRNA (guanosine2251-2'-O)-methyltransferase
LDLLYGRNAVLEAVGARRRRIQRILVARGAHGLDPFFALDRPVSVVERDQLTRLVGHDHHQAVVAEAEPFHYAAFAEILNLPAPLILVLDSLQDPQNFGTLLRTAQAIGIGGVVIPEHRAVGVTPAVSNASAGAVERLRVARATNLARALNSLKERQVWVHGLAVGAQQPYWSVDWQAPSALVVGAEGPGLSRLVRATCDTLISIPMAEGAVQSLNASVAGSLVLYEAFRQRR